MIPFFCIATRQTSEKLGQRSGKANNDYIAGNIKLGMFGNAAFIDSKA